MAETIFVFVHGVVSVGKSTFIQAISEIDIRPRLNGVLIQNLSPDTPTDFGRVVVERGKYLLYMLAYIGGKTTPQDEKILSDPDRRITYCVVVNPTKTYNKSNNYYQETTFIIEDTSGRNRPFLVISSKRKDEDSYSITELRELLELSEIIPFLECDPVTDPSSAKQVLLELFKLLPQDDLVSAAIEMLEKDITL